MTFAEIKAVDSYNLEYLTDELTLYRHIYQQVLILVHNSFTYYCDMDFNDYCVFIDFYTNVFQLLHEDMKEFNKNKSYTNDITLDYIKNKFKIVNFTLLDEYDIVNGKFVLDFCGNDILKITVFLGMKNDD